jgi:hypothetical protein
MAREAKSGSSRLFFFVRRGRFGVDRGVERGLTVSGLRTWLGCVPCGLGFEVELPMEREEVRVLVPVVFVAWSTTRAFVKLMYPVHCFSIAVCSDFRVENQS